FCQVDRAGLALAGAPVSTGAGAASAVVTPDGTKLYVACPADDPASNTGKVRVYATAGNQQAAPISGFPPGTAPAVLAVSSDQKYLYVATSPKSSAAGRIDVVNA